MEKLIQLTLRESLALLVGIVIAIFIGPVTAGGFLLIVFVVVLLVNVVVEIGARVRTRFRA